MTSRLSQIIVVLALFIAVPALAGTPVTLNANLTDATGHVTLGELFDDAGPARDVVVAERTGPSVVLDAGANEPAAAGECCKLPTP
jgi:flagella basal body P-ring formation protein FlgA